MRITNIQDAASSINSDIQNAFISFSEMNVSIVAVQTDVIRGGEPVVGYGFTSNGRYSQSAILRERFIPRIQNADPRELVDSASDNLDATKIWQTFMKNEKPGGHGDRAHAAGALDMAIWDVIAKIAEQPLWKLLSERYNENKFDEKVMVYPGGGYYYPGKAIDALKSEMSAYQEQGYTVLKMKIGGADLKTDLSRIEAVIDVTGSENLVAVDANGRFSYENAIEYADALSAYDLFWFEEPVDPLDFKSNAEIAKRYSGSIATGENLFSHQDGSNLLLYAGLRPERDWIQIDPALSYGLTDYLEFLAVVDRLGWSRRRLIPHGGHQFALNIAAGLQLGGSESYPGVFHPFGGFADNLTIKNGFAPLPDAPGIGIELKAELLDRLKSKLGI